MLFNKSLLSSLTHLFILSSSLFSSVAVYNSLPILATEKETDNNQGELYSQTITKNQLPNGTYLYGTSSERDQIGQDYMIFKVYQGEVQGAIYRPRSEFNCFTGIFDNGQISMSIVDFYGTSHDYAVRLTIPSTASTNSSWTEVELDGYHRIDFISQSDKKILDTCLS